MSKPLFRWDDRLQIQTSSWQLNGFPDYCSNIGSTVSYRGFVCILFAAGVAGRTKCLVLVAFRISSHFSSYRIRHNTPLYVCVCMCVFSSHSFWISISLDAPAGVTQEEGHTGFLIHLLPAVRTLIFIARRIQPFLSLVDREVEFCVLTI